MLATRMAALRAGKPRFTAAARSYLRKASSSARLADGDLKEVRPMFELKGKNFVVTGGGRGIGYAATRAITEMGGNVAVLDILPKPVGDFEKLSAEHNVKTLYIPGSVTKESDVVGAFEKAAMELGSIDGW
jgi:sorbose reductase